MLNGATSLAAGSAATVSGSGTLTGFGIVHGMVTVGAGGTISPGNAVLPIGVLTAGSAVFQPGGALALDLAKNPIGGVAGTNWSQLAVTGALNLSALSSGSRFTIQLESTDPTQFNTALNKVWASVLTTGSILGFDPNDFLIDNSGFGPVTGTFSLVADGTNLDLDFTSGVPEPSTWALLAGFGALAAAAIGRRRKSEPRI